MSVSTWPRSRCAGLHRNYTTHKLPVPTVLAVTNRHWWLRVLNLSRGDLSPELPRVAKPRFEGIWGPSRGCARWPLSFASSSWPALRAEACSSVGKQHQMGKCSSLGIWMGRPGAACAASVCEHSRPLRGFDGHVLHTATQRQSLPIHRQRLLGRLGSIT